MTSTTVRAKQTSIQRVTLRINRENVLQPNKWIRRWRHLCCCFVFFYAFSCSDWTLHLRKVFDWSCFIMNFLLSFSSMSLISVQEIKVLWPTSWCFFSKLLLCLSYRKTIVLSLRQLKFAFCSKVSYRSCFLDKDFFFKSSTWFAMNTNGRSTDSSFLLENRNPSGWLCKCLHRHVEYIKITLLVKLNSTLRAMKMFAHFNGEGRVRGWGLFGFKWTCRKGRNLEEEAILVLIFSSSNFHST